MVAAGQRLRAMNLNTDEDADEARTKGTEAQRKGICVQRFLDCHVKKLVLYFDKNP